MLKEFEASGKTLDEALDRVSILSGHSLDELNIEVLAMPSKGFLGIGHKDARVKATIEVPDPVQPKAKRPQAQGKEEQTGSTFGTKKSRREKAEAKKAKTDFSFQPIISIDPEQGIPDSIVQEAKANAPKVKKEGEAKVKKEKDGESRRNRREKPEKRERRSEKREAQAKPRRESKAIILTEGEMADSVLQEAKAFLTPIFTEFGIAPTINAEIKEGILYLSFTGEKLGILIGRRGETLNALQYLTNLVVNKQRNGHVRLVLDVENYRSGRAETLEALAHKMAEKAVRTGRRIELEPMNPHERRVVHLALQEDKRVDTISHGEEPYRRVVISKRRDRKDRRNRKDKRHEDRAEERVNQDFGQELMENQALLATEMELAETLAKQAEALAKEIPTEPFFAQEESQDKENQEA